jgi:uncharacterized protein YcaQ
MEEHLPQWSDHEEWPEQRVVYEAVQKSLRALGVGTAAHIKNHFIRGRYPGLAQILGELENDGLITQVHVVNGGDRLPRKWYVHQDVLPLLDRVSSETWESRTILLSPFDNLICDRARTEALFGFEYRSEIYTPKKKRQYGYYVMPILHGDRLVGRLDPRLDRKRKRLTINALYWEPTVTLSDALAASVEQAIESLAAFLGAADIEYL